MNAPAFPTNPSVGEFFGNWVWNGARWVCSPAAGVRVVIQTFLVSGPYMPSQGLVTAVAECYGGGGGGGEAVGQATYLGSGGAGGSGGYSKIALAAALVAGGVQVTIGAGGAGGVAGTNNGFGGPGLATTFGALCVANGGAGGSAVGSAGGMGDGGPGAMNGVGDVTFRGAAGGTGAVVGTPSALTFAAASQGGTILGGNDRVANFTAGQAFAGAAAVPNTGSGGSGGAYHTTTTTVAGGAGGSGLCTVTEYCWADVAPDGDCNVVNVNARVAVTREPFPGPGSCPPGWTQVSYDGEG